MMNLIKEKQDHTSDNPHLMGQSWINGKPQRFLYSKEEITSPNMSLNPFSIMLLIDAQEPCFVAWADGCLASKNSQLTIT